MTLYAHALIEVPVDPEDATQGVIKYNRGDTVPDDLDGIEYLMEGNAVSAEDYDPAMDEVPAPDVIEIDGVKYVKSADAAEVDVNAST